MTSLESRERTDNGKKNGPPVFEFVEAMLPFETKSAVKLQPVRFIPGARENSISGAMPTRRLNAFYSSDVRVTLGECAAVVKGCDGNSFRHVAARDLRSDPGHALTALWCSVATAVWTATCAHVVAVSP